MEGEEEEEREKEWVKREAENVSEYKTDRTLKSGKTKEYLKK